MREKLQRIQLGLYHRTCTTKNMSETMIRNWTLIVLVKKQNLKHAVDIETDNLPSKPQSKGSIYSQNYMVVICKPYLCLSIAISDIAEEEKNYSRIIFSESTGSPL